VRLSRHTNTQETRQMYTHIHTHKNALSLARARSLPHTHVQARDIKAGTVLSCYAGKLSFSSVLSQEVHAQKLILSLFLSLPLSPCPLSLRVSPTHPPPVVYTIFFPFIPCFSTKGLPSCISRSICFSHGKHYLFSPPFFAPIFQTWGGGASENC
jgi:hypothetical protein